jgi:hypothetical protein
MRIAERALLPRVCAAPRATTVLADGFSCREQIEQGTGRPTRHLAELAAAALGIAVEAERPVDARRRNPAMIGGLTLIGIGLAWALVDRRRRASVRPA